MGCPAAPPTRPAGGVSTMRITQPRNFDWTWTATTERCSTCTAIPSQKTTLRWRRGVCVRAGWPPFDRCVPSTAPDIGGLSSTRSKRRTASRWTRWFGSRNALPLDRRVRRPSQPSVDRNACKSTSTSACSRTSQWPGPLPSLSKSKRSDFLPRAPAFWRHRHCNHSLFFRAHFFQTEIKRSKTKPRIISMKPAPGGTCIYVFFSC